MIQIRYLKVILLAITLKDKSVRFWFLFKQKSVSVEELSADGCSAEIRIS